MTDTPRTGLEFVDAGTTDIDQPVNNNALALDAVVGMSVVSATTTAEPTLTSPADDGKVYILPAGRTGTNWGAQAVGTIAQWYSGNWYFYAPWSGLRARSSTTGIIYQYTTSWAVWASVDAQLLMADTDVPRLGTENTWTAAQTLNANGGTAPTPTSGTLVQVIQANSTASRIRQDATASFASYEGFRANGTLGSPTALVANDIFFTVAGGGYNGSAYTTARANFIFRASENWTTTANGTQWVLQLTPTGGTSASGVLICDSTQFYPNVNNAVSLGIDGRRWTEVFATNGAINTSDARLKTEVRPFTSGELAAARDLSESVGFFRFLDRVEIKGRDAREHCGLTVQGAISIMHSHGLDPFAYGFICHDEWPASDEVRDDEGNVIQEAQEAGDLYSFRPDQLDRFIAKGLHERLKALEAK